MASFRRNPYARTADEVEKAENLGITHPNVPPPPDKFHASALHKYNQAIRQFKQRIEHGSVPPHLVLTSCALFFCIEVIRDNLFAALALVNNGVQMLKYYGSTFSKGQQDGLFKTFKLMFSRMGLTAATIGHALPMEDLPALTSVGQVSSFGSIMEARDALFAIMSDSRDFIKAASAWKDAVVPSMSKNSSPSKHLVNGEKINMIETMYGASYKWVDKNEVPPRQDSAALSSLTSSVESPENDNTIVNDNIEDWSFKPLLTLPERYQSEDLPEMLQKLQFARLNLLGHLDWWWTTFQGIDEHVRVAESETVAFLLMYYHATFTWANTRLDLAETIFDGFTFHFEQIVHHADIYLSAASTEGTTFTFETGAVAPLFLTATRCRIPSLRRRALDLMKKAPRKECFHGAESTAEIASRVSLNCLHAHSSR